MKKPVKPISKELRKVIRLQFHHQVIHEIRSKCLEKARREIEADQWDDLKQLRLDGVLHICKHAKPKNLTLSVIAWLAYQNGLHIDFKFLPKERDDIEFTDTGLNTRQTSV